MQGGGGGGGGGGRGVIIDREESYDLCSDEVYMCLEQNVAFILQLPPKTCRYIQNLLLFKKAVYLAAFYTGETLSDQFKAK